MFVLSFANNRQEGDFAVKTAAVIRSIAVALMILAVEAQAEVKIQSAQYNDQKGVVFVKGKTDAATTVYVVNSATQQQLAEVSAARGQFKKNVVVSSGRIPCSITVQTNSPRAGSWFWDASSSDGESSTRNVRHAPRGCQ